MRNEAKLQDALDLVDNKYQSFKDFIKSKNPTYCEIREDLHEVIFDEVDYYGRQYMIIVPYIEKNKTVKVIFRDDLTDITRLWEQYNVDLDNAKPMYNKLIADIEVLGCELYNSGCGGNDDYEWYDLSMSLLDFNEEILKKCTDLWNVYNKKLSEHCK